MCIWCMLSCLEHLHPLSASPIPPPFFCGSPLFPKFLCSNDVAIAPTSVILSREFHFYYFLLWLMQYSDSYISTFRNPQSCHFKQLQLADHSSSSFQTYLLTPARSLEMPLIYVINSTFKSAEFLSCFWAPWNFKKRI